MCGCVKILQHIPKIVTKVQVWTLWCLCQSMYVVNSGSQLTSCFGRITLLIRPDQLNLPQIITLLLQSCTLGTRHDGSNTSSTSLLNPVLVVSASPQLFFSLLDAGLYFDPSEAESNLFHRMCLQTWLIKKMRSNSLHQLQLKSLLPAKHINHCSKDPVEGSYPFA